MDGLKAEFMTTVSIPTFLSTPDNELSLPILVDDVVWEIVNYLCLRDLLMVHKEVPQWRSMTSKLLSKQEIVSCDYKYKDDRGIPKEWLMNECLHEWNLLLDVCSNLKELNLFGLLGLGVGQIAKIFECITRLCKNLKVLHFNYNYGDSRISRYAKTAVQIDMTKEEFMFPWIPLWTWYNQNIILTSTMLEPQSRISNCVLDCVKQILVKFQPYIREPYWFCISFERKRKMRDLATNTWIDVALLKSITLGICESKTNSNQLFKNWPNFRTYQAKLIVDKDFPEALETVCLELTQLEELNNLFDAFSSLERLHRTYTVQLHQESFLPDYKCRCCACWWHVRCRSAKQRYCGHCDTKLAWYEWNTHWITEYKYDGNCDGSKYEAYDYQTHGHLDRKYTKYESRSSDGVAARENDILDSIC